MSYPIDGTFIKSNECRMNLLNFSPHKRTIFHRQAFKFYKIFPCFCPSPTNGITGNIFKNAICIHYGTETMEHAKNLWGKITRMQTLRDKKETWYPYSRHGSTSCVRCLNVYR